MGKIKRFLLNFFFPIRPQFPDILKDKKKESICLFKKNETQN